MGEKYDIAFLGGGPAGYQGAIRAAQLGAKVAVVGGGPVGVEMAAIFRELAGNLLTILQRRKIKIHSGTTVKSMAERDEAFSVLLSNGIEVMPDTVLQALGRRFKTEDIGLEHLGRRTEQGRILAGGHLETNPPGHYAAGDVIGGCLLARLGVSTVCDSARCPNRGECFSHATATFLILGEVCTRRCAFCAVRCGRPEGPPDAEEPERLCSAVAELGLTHVVITSVTRDDLPDGGAGHYARVIEALHRHCPGVTVEVLVPDFQGSEESLSIVLEAHPDILAYNVETVPRLYPEVRQGADYSRSLALLQQARSSVPRVIVKSGFMLGLGETAEEIEAVFQDLAAVGCDMVTLGQYLAPSLAHATVNRYVLLSEFDYWRDTGLRMGLKSVVSGPLVRSSYKASYFLKGFSWPSGVFWIREPCPLRLTWPLTRPCFSSMYRGNRYEAFSAGTEPTIVHPAAIAAMAEIGIDIRDHRSKGLSSFENETFDEVVTVCGHARETCPVVPGTHIKRHRGFEDPTAAGPERDSGLDSQNLLEPKPYSRHENPWSHLKKCHRVYGKSSFLRERRAIMGDKIMIYGTETCPFCKQARAAYGERAVFINVDDPAKLEEMLAYSGGKRTVPVIVEGDKVTVGFLGDTSMKGGVPLFGGG